jgi:C_GCAxxG_C_C family probable redox protein
MDRIMNKLEQAAHYHEIGYGCAQCVLAPYSRDFGLDEGLALRLSTGFGSGMGRMCEVCGALAGAFIVVSMKYGKEITDGTRYGTDTETTYALVAEIARKFKEKNGSIYCRDLIGYDLMDPFQREKVVEMGLFTTICRRCILDAVELLQEIL